MQDDTRRNIILKFNARHEKDNYNRTLCKMKLKSLCDVKNCSFEQRNEYTLE